MSVFLKNYMGKTISYFFFLGGAGYIWHLGNGYFMHQSCVSKSGEQGKGCNAGGMLAESYCRCEIFFSSSEGTFPFWSA